MMEWWETREPREKLLIRIFGGLLVAAIVIQFVLLPILSNRAENETRNMQAMQTLDVVTSSDVILKKKFASVAGATSDISVSELRTVALSLAAARGLAISRIDGGNGDKVIMIMDNANPQILYAWLADIQLQYDTKPSSISLSGDASGGVRASVAFEGAQ